MSGNGFIYGTAEYRLASAGVMHVTAPGVNGDLVTEAVGIPLGLGEKPTARALSTTPWRNVPGQGWREDEKTGTFRISVVRDEP